MSLILEALRKSEAERRRGQTPDLLSDATVVVPATRVATRNAGAMIAVVVAALLTLLLVAWWLKPAAVEPRDESTAVDSSPVAASPSPPSLSQPQAPLRAPASRPPTAAVTPAPAPLTPPRAAAQPIPANGNAATTRDSSERMAAAAEPEPAPAALPQPIAMSEPRLPEPPAAQPTFTSPDVPLKLADLSSDERQQLPTLKVSMHMWASETANRFAIIDGARVNEGDRVGEATVEAIQQDGVLLSWRGRRIKLPIR